MNTKASNLSGAQVFIAALKRHGVDIMFGQSIPTLFYLATPDYGIEQITYRTENAGAVMADAYARISGRIPVVTAQNGPAATLLVAGLAEALTASIPIVALVQEVPAQNRDRNAFQELDQLELFKGSAKWIRRVSEPGRIDDYVDMAFRAAGSGRPGPAVLLCPADLIERAGIASSSRQENLGTYPLDRPVADPVAVSKAADLLAAADNPFVWAGGGVHSSRAWGDVATLQETCHLPVATTTMGKGVIDESHPLSMGVIGYYMGTGGATRYLRPMIERADVILAVGNRTNQNGTDSWTLLPESARIIHIDIDPMEIGRNYEALRLVGDASLTLRALTAQLEQRDLTKRQNARSHVETEISSARLQHLEERSARANGDAHPIRPEKLMADLDAMLTPEHIVVADASYASIWICNNLMSRRPGMRFLTPRGMAGLGWGLPYALGAKLAEPKAPVFALVGDGGFAHVWSELETAYRHGLHVVLVVLNNQILGYQKHAENARYGDHTGAVYFQPVDHAAIARACGCRGVTITEAAAFQPALAEAFAAAKDATTVIDVLVDPDAHPPITAFES